MLMFSWWGAAMSRLRWGVLILAGVLSAFAAIWGAGVFGSLSEGGFEQPGSESERAIERIDDEVGRQGVDLIALYSSDRRTVADPQFRDAVLAVAERVGDHPDVTAVQSIYT
ncbi:MAG: MMPL family transporter, partial [bacterium]